MAITITREESNEERILDRFLGINEELNEEEMKELEKKLREEASVLLAKARLVADLREICHPQTVRN